MISRQPSLTLTASMSHSHPQKIGPWKLGKTLGRGATGRVLLGVHQTTGQKAAVKVVSKSELGEEHGAKARGLPYGIEREIIIMKLLTHPNVLRLYDVWETSKALYLVLEYVEGGELFDLLVERGPLHEQEAVKYFRQIILGTAYCHALGICHRDLKPENLLLDASLNVKLADFGMAALESNGKLLETSCGLPHYAAPEIVSGLKYHGAASDVWSCGVILFALLTGRLPFDDENIRNLLLKVQAGTFEMPHDLSPEAQDLIWRMLTVDPNDRISTSMVLNHRLLAKYTIPNEDLISVKSLPHPDTAHRSLGSRKNIDRQILENLSILWNKRPEEDIIRCLLADGANPEKTFYALLLRYRHNQDEMQGLAGGSGRADAASPKKKLPRLSSNLSNTTKKKRVSQINASTARNRPVSFQRRYGVRPDALVHDSLASSVHNSPYKSPTRARALPRKLPHKRRSYRANDDPLPRNIYNDIVSASGAPTAVDLMLSIPPTLPSKDLIYAATGAADDSLTVQNNSPRKPTGNTLSEAPNLVSGTSKAKKRTLMIHSSSKGASGAMNKNAKRKSFRQSMTSGLKRNSITIKLLSTYAKLSSETDWEYMDKQTKRTSATFATLCDKIFNHEEYNEEDEKLIDEEEKKAKEYEALMEIERKKHEAEFRARRELAKQKKRQNRRSILSLKKLHITVTEDGTDNTEAVDSANSDVAGTLLQPKRGQKAGAVRSVSEQGASDKNDLTAADLELLKRRSATQPIPRRRQTPALSRRPVSRLDPLWIAFENKEITRAQDALAAEYADLELERSRKQAHRELMVSVVYPDDGGDNDEFDTDRRYELPQHELDGVNLSDEYMTEIRKLRLLNSQYNLHTQLNVDGAKRVSVARSGNPNRRTLIGEVEIPKVTRKSTNFGKPSAFGSNKRLSLISFRSTKELYRDLNSFLDTHREDLDDEDLAEEEQLGRQTMPKLRTSFADRLDRVDSENADDRGDVASVMDFDEHLANKRTSYYGAGKGSKPRSMLLPEDNIAEERADLKAADKTTRRESKHSKKSHTAGIAEAEYTFSEEDHGRRRALGALGVFDKIKLPESGQNNAPIGNSNKKASNGSDGNARKSTSHRVSAHQPGPAMLVPNINKINQLERNEYRKDPKGSKYGELSHNANSMSDISFDASTVVTTKTGGDGKKNEKAGARNALSHKEAKPEVPEKRSRSIFRKMSWGTKKSLEENPQQLPSPAHSGLNSVEEKKESLFSRIFSGEKPEVQRFNTILPKREIMTALYALLASWRNFGLKHLKKDLEGFNITGAVSSTNSFHMKGCKFRIKVAGDGAQKSQLICAHVRGSKTTAQTLFKEIRKVLEREGVMDL